MMNTARISLQLFVLLIPFFKVGSAQSKIVKTQGTNAYQNISCGIEDHAGILWFGTSGEGVYQYDGKVFTQFTIKNGLSDNIVSSIFEDKQHNVWVGTKKGLCRFDGKIMKQVPITSGAFFQPPFANSNYSSNQVFSMLQDRKGIIWLGTAEGVFLYDGKSFKTLLGEPGIVNDSSLTLKSVQCLFEDKKGNIWMGSGPMAFEGLCVYDGKTVTKANLTKENWVRVITESNNGTLLFATRRRGVMAYDEKGFSPFAQPPELKNDLLNYIYKDSKGNIWYASDYVDDRDIVTGGLWKFDGKSFTSFTKQDGLSNTSVSFLLEDRKGNTWIGTRNTGLYRYKEKKFTALYE